MSGQLDKSPFRDVPPLPHEDQELVKLYMEFGIPVDRLAFSEEFKRMVNMLRERGDQRPESEIFNRLLNLRKAGRLPRVA